MKVKLAIEFEFEFENLAEPGVIPAKEIRKIFEHLKKGYDSQPAQYMRMNDKYAWITEKDPDYNHVYPDFITCREEKENVWGKRT